MTSDAISSSASRGSSRSIRNRSRRRPSPTSNDGGSPRRTACAPRTIMLPAAWRKMCVSSATGHDLRLHQLRERLAGADRARAGRRRRPARRACPTPTARSSVTSSSRFAIDVSSTTSRSALISSRVGPSPGNPAQSGVDRRRVHPGRLGHPARGAAGRGDERDRRVLRLGRGADQPDRRRLAGARAAGDDREPRAERGLDRGPLLGRGDEVVGGWSGSVERRLQHRARRRIVAASSASSAAVGGR